MVCVGRPHLKLLTVEMKVSPARTEGEPVQIEVPQGDHDRYALCTGKTQTNRGILPVTSEWEKEETERSLRKGEMQHWWSARQKCVAEILVFVSRDAQRPVRQAVMVILSPIN